MDSFPQSHFDQDFYGVFIQELNDTLNAPRLNLNKHPAFQVPMMFWTDHDCYLLMELARAAPDIIDTLPKIKVASDPASTDFFYERLRDIAQNARMELAAGGGNYAVIRKFSDDISQKIPMPWHAPGWKNQLSGNASMGNNTSLHGSKCAPKMNYWPAANQSRQVRNTSSSLLPGYTPVPQNMFAINETAPTETSLGPKPPPPSEDFIKLQDEFFMSPAQHHENHHQSNWLEKSCLPPSLSSMFNSHSLKFDCDGNNRAPSSFKGGCNSGPLYQSSHSWMHGSVESSSDCIQVPTSSSSGCVQGRYWPKQMHPKDCNNYDTNQAPKMGQVYPACVRPMKSLGGPSNKNNQHCRLNLSEQPERSSPTNTPKENYLCVFCKGNNEPEAIYKSHPLRLNNIVICPSLRNYTCCICKATGDNAHTIKYCPFNKRGFFATRSHEKCNSNNNSRIKMKVQIIEGANNGSNSPPSQGSSSDLFHQRNFKPISMMYDPSPDMDDEHNTVGSNDCLDDSGDDEFEGSNNDMKLIISVEKPSGCRYGRC